LGVVVPVRPTKAGEAYEAGRPTGRGKITLGLKTKTGRSLRQTGNAISGLAAYSYSALTVRIALQRGESRTEDYLAVYGLRIVLSIET
jgi:hypothetical protein